MSMNHNNSWHASLFICSRETISQTGTYYTLGAMHHPFTYTLFGSSVLLNDENINKVINITTCFPFLEPLLVISEEIKTAIEVTSWPDSSIVTVCGLTKQTPASYGFIWVDEVTCCKKIQMISYPWNWGFSYEIHNSEKHMMEMFWKDSQRQFFR